MDIFQVSKRVAKEISKRLNLKTIPAVAIKIIKLYIAGFKINDIASEVNIGKRNVWIYLNIFRAELGYRSKLTDPFVYDEDRKCLTRIDLVKNPVVQKKRTDIRKNCEESN